MSDYIELKPVMDFINSNIALAKKQVEANKTSADFWQGYYTAKEEIYRAMRAFLETEPKSDFERNLNTDFGRAVVCPNCGARMDEEDKYEIP